MGAREYRYVVIAGPKFLKWTWVLCAKCSWVL